jgi:hypothetical protein
MTNFLNKCRTCGQDICSESETRASRGFLEGAVIPAYCKWQYNIDPKAKGKDEARRYLFKKDFNYEIVERRDGQPQRIPISTKGIVKQVLERFTRYAEENGCPIPNPALYKLYKQKYSMDYRFITYQHFLDFLGLEVDSMPSQQTFDVLEPDPIDYPIDEFDEKVFE